MVNGRLLPEPGKKIVPEDSRTQFRKLQGGHSAPKLIVVAGDRCLRGLSQDPLDQPGSFPRVRPDDRAPNRQRIGYRRFAEELRSAVKIGWGGHIGFKTNSAVGRENS